MNEWMNECMNEWMNKHLFTLDTQGEIPHSVRWHQNSVIWILTYWRVFWLLFIGSSSGSSDSFISTLACPEPSHLIREMTRCRWKGLIAPDKVQVLLQALRWGLTPIFPSCLSSKVILLYFISNQEGNEVKFVFVSHSHSVSSTSPHSLNLL